MNIVPTTKDRNVEDGVRNMDNFQSLRALFQELVDAGQTVFMLDIKAPEYGNVKLSELTQDRK